MGTQISLKNDYALVTGASDGLGREFAVQLASMGMSLVLVARSESGLNETARLLKLAANQKVLVLAADLTDPSAFGRIREFLAQNSVRIKLLVNNAGSGGWGKFEAMTPDLYSKMIDLNVKAPVLLSELLLDDLSYQAGSAIINVSSLAAIQPVPYMSVYAATKSFMTHFSLALWNEWEMRGVYVQTLMPGAIATRFDDKNGGFKAPFPKDPASEIVKMSLTELMTARRPIVYAKRSWSQRAFRMWLPLPFLVREVGKVFSPARSR